MKAKILNKKILSNIWGEYAQYTIEYTRRDGSIEQHTREIQHNGNGAAVLVYNREQREVVLIKQFRLASMIGGNEGGVLIEVCAGLVENGDAEYTIKKEIYEELGFEIKQVTFHYKGFATPGAKTELIYFFTAQYDNLTPRGKGGGRPDEHEDIEIITIPFDEAYDMIATGEIIDLKTISLLHFAKINIFM